ncbi:MAG: saccharopine dehydrogenase C-terminal domain-containing protein [Candidatus Bathyarchaeia archaeon]|jgi:saccharopine dehydrogenase (NAD+, L-lysine-forming)
MKVVVLGGAGLTGKCAVRDLIESPEVSEVLVGDVDSERLGKFVSILGSSKVTAEVVDVRNHDSLVSLLKGANVTVNAVQYYFNLDVMKAALMARTHYVDLGGLYHMTKRQLELDKDFRKAGLTAVVGMGCVPGISNAMARWAVDRLDSVDTIRIRDGWRDFTPNAPRFVATWSIQTFTDEFTQNAVIFENGQLREIPPLTLAEKVALPPPIGEIEAFTTLHSELATFPTSFKEKGIKNVNWKEGGPKGWHLDYELIVALGLMRDEPLRVADRVFVSPRQFFLKQLAHNNLLGHPEDVVPDDWECSRVEVLGKKNGKSAEMQLEVLYSAKKEWKASSAQYGVGIPASIVSQMLCEGQIQKAGVLPPENCVDPTILFKELEKRNMPIMIRGPAGMVSWSTSGA